MAVVSTGYEYNFVETIGDQTTNIQKKTIFIYILAYRKSSVVINKSEKAKNKTGLTLKLIAKK